MAVQSVPPSGTVTFLFTDVEGSTRLWEEHPAEMQIALQRHDEVLRSAIGSHGGYVFSTAGDAFAAAFGRVGDGLDAAVAAQAMLGAERWPNQTPIRVRMGLHTGEAQERDGDYFGPALNRTARIMAAGHGGQVLVSAAAAGLADRSDLYRLGEHRLKDLQAPEELWQLGAGEFAALGTLDVVRHNLPVQRTELLGREHEIVSVSGLVSQQRLVTLTGGGGAGKTRLALAVAAEAATGFNDGVFFVDLAPLTDGGRVGEAAVQAAGLSMEGVAGSGYSPVEFAAALLARRDLLLVLDNCEHVIDDAAEFVDTLLGAGDGVQVLATSREALDVDGEHNFRVPPLAVDAALRGGGPAVELFVRRAAAAGVTLDAGDGSILRVYERLDGIPLAIELAAAQTSVMGPADLEGRLDERFELLVGGRGRRGRERHHTLRAVLDSSWGLLSGAEQQLLAQLAVFSGGWTLSGAEAVCEVSGSVPVLLRALVAKSLVEPVGGVDGFRFKMLETVRLYASERLTESGSESRCRDRHLGWLVDWVNTKTIDDYWCDRSWRNEFVSELDNVRAAMGWALGHDRPGDAASVITAGSLAWWEGWGTGEVEPWTEQVLAMMSSPPAGLLFTGAVVAWVAGRADQMAHWYHRAIDAAQAAGQLDVLAAAQAQFGFVTASINTDEALRLMEQATQNAATAGARHIEALASVWATPCHFVRGDFELAVAGCSRALALDTDPVGARNADVAVEQGESTPILGGTVALTDRVPSSERVRVNHYSPAESASFAGYRFPPEVILLAVRWYLRYGLSYRDVEELLAERGIDVDHVSIFRWVQRFTPLLIDAARPCRHSVGDRWFVDETYVKVAGVWRYAYRAVDQHGQVIDVYVSKRRNITAARHFFETALTDRGRPTEVTTDLAAPLLRVVEELIPEAAHDTEQYSNNRIENDHGRLKARLRPMRGLLTDRTASIVVRGHAFVQNLRRGHYELGVEADRDCLRVAAAFDELAAVI